MFVSWCALLLLALSSAKTIMSKQSMRFPTHVMINPEQNQLQFRLMNCFQTKSVFVRVPIENAKFNCEQVAKY